MRILILGSGGREHALAWKVNQSPLVKNIFCIPGNPGTAEIAENISGDLSDFKSLIQFVKQNAIDLTIVGPEQPLVDGIVDAFTEENLAIFGPSKAAAQLEGSKAFSKDLMQKHGIPTAQYATFTQKNAAQKYLDEQNSYPIVLKADGLAAGKGVLICHTRVEAIAGLDTILTDKAFGEAGAQLVIEEFLDGDEFSLFALCDGTHYHLFPAAQDHKKVGEGDTGKNTGGMGAYAPAPIATAAMIEKAKAEVVEPVLKAMKEDGMPYKGLLFIGFMVQKNIPYVLEFNCRFGDPETQALLPLIKSDLIPFLQKSIDGTLNTLQMEFNTGCTMDVVLTAGGYPDSYEKNKVIHGVDQLPDDVILFHAGTVLQKDKLLTHGGRVLNLVAKESDFKTAAEKVYSAINKIEFEKMYYRKDIGFKVLK